MFGEVALTLHDLGWRPLPCDGKAAILHRWNELCRIPWDRDDLISAATELSAFNAGIAADEQHVFLDLDILDPHLAHEITGIADQILGPTPLIRVGQAPKQVRIYRNGSLGHIRSRKLHPIEIMSGSGMVVAYGVHPSTHHQYIWITGTSPLTISADSAEVPLVDHLQLQRFLNEADRLLARAHYVGSDRTHGRQSTGDRTTFAEIRQHLRIASQVIGFERAAILLLREVREGNRHATAFEIITSAAGRNWSEERIIRLFEAHFAGWSGVSDDAFRRILNLCFGDD